MLTLFEHEGPSILIKSWHLTFMHSLLVTWALSCYLQRQISVLNSSKGKVVRFWQVKVKELTTIFYRFVRKSHLKVYQWKVYLKKKMCLLKTPLWIFLVFFLYIQNSFFLKHWIIAFYAAYFTTFLKMEQHNSRLRNRLLVHNQNYFFICS